jgi:hypothetical protein
MRLHSIDVYEVSKGDLDSDLAQGDASNPLQDVQRNSWGSAAVRQVGVSCNNVDARRVGGDGVVDGLHGDGDLGAAWLQRAALMAW